MNAYDTALLVVGLTGLVGFVAFGGYLILTKNRNLPERTGRAVGVAAVSNLAFFLCTSGIVLAQAEGSPIAEIRYLPWIIVGIPIALVLGYISRHQADSLLDAIKHPVLYTLLYSATSVLLLDWLITLGAGLTLSFLPHPALRYRHDSIQAVIERVPLLGVELFYMCVIAFVFWEASGPQIPSRLLMIRNLLFFTGTSCWIVAEILEMSFPLVSYSLEASPATTANVLLTLLQAILLCVSVSAWLLGFILHRKRTRLDEWKVRFLQWSRLRERIGLARAKIRYLSNGSLATHEHHLKVAAKSLGMNECDQRKAILVLHLACAISEEHGRIPLSDYGLKIDRKDLLKCAVLQGYLIRNRVSPIRHFASDKGNLGQTYSLDHDLLYEALYPTLLATSYPLRLVPSRYHPLWTQLAFLSVAYAGLIPAASQAAVLSSRTMNKKIVAAYDLSLYISTHEHLRSIPNNSY